MSRRTKLRARTGFISKLNTARMNQNVPDSYSSIEDELVKYDEFQNNLSNEEMDKINQRSLAFFKSNFKSFPKLGKLCRIIMSVPATAVPSESLFSGAGLTQTDLRNRLNPENLDKLNFIKTNF